MIIIIILITLSILLTSITVERRRNALLRGKAVMEDPDTIENFIIAQMTYNILLCKFSKWA